MTKVILKTESKNMNTPANSIKHIVPASNRSLNPLYFEQDGKKYDFVIIFGIKKPENIFTPQVQSVRFVELPDGNGLIRFKKGDDSTNVFKIASLRYLRIDEFELVRRCLSRYDRHIELKRDSVVNPVAATVSEWVRRSQHELHIFQHDFFEVLKAEIMDVDLESLYNTPWIEP